MAVRVAIVTESFLPSVNGVTTSVCRVAECLRRAGHEVMVVAPRPAPRSFAGCPVHAVASVPVRQFPVGLPTAEMERLLRSFAPDVVHVASPFVLGAAAVVAANRCDLPAVAVYQTDMPGYLQRHVPGLAGRGAARTAWRWVRWVHRQAALTLAPSTPALADLRRHGIPRTALWGRGVDTAQFHPGWRDDAGTAALRRQLAPNGELVVGYVGRLAPEKELHRLAELAGLPHLRVAVVGDGPSAGRDRAALEGAGLDAVFLGRREGDDLARAYAALDVFVHTGTRETFGQTLQEAAATGLPVVAPARGGPLDLVDHGGSGLLFDPDRPGGLAGAVSSLYDDEMRARLGTRGRTLVAHRSWLSLVDQLLAHYGSLTAPAARAA